MRPDRGLVLLAGLALLGLGALACGGRSGSTPPSTEPPAADDEGALAQEIAAVSLDCQALASRIHTCADAFAAAWAQTSESERSGDPERFMTLFRQEHNRDGLGLPLCQDSWQSRDPRWKDRLKICEGLQDCAEFSACAAPAIGDPLPPPTPR